MLRKVNEAIIAEGTLITKVTYRLFFIHIRAVLSAGSNVAYCNNRITLRLLILERIPPGSYSKACSGFTFKKRSEKKFRSKKMIIYCETHLIQVLKLD